MSLGENLIFLGMGGVGWAGLLASLRLSLLQQIGYTSWAPRYAQCLGRGMSLMQSFSCGCARSYSVKGQVRDCQIFYSYDICNL